VDHTDGASPTTHRQHRHSTVYYHPHDVIRDWSWDTTKTHLPVHPPSSRPLQGSLSKQGPSAYMERLETTRSWASIHARGRDRRIRTSTSSIHSLCRYPSLWIARFGAPLFRSMIIHSIQHIMYVSCITVIFRAKYTSLLRLTMTVK
jgi:hypothetical protein